MKKKLFLILFMMFLFASRVNASNIINDMDILVYLNEDGSAKITETWVVDGEDGTEWYKVMNNLGNMQLNNFKVSMDGQDLIYKKWNVNESLLDKSGYYGINYTNSGLELCFGKYDYNEHTFVLSYDLSNFIINTDDSQLIYYRFIDSLSNVDFRNYSVRITGFYDFPDTLDVWGYGYKGYAYVNNGKIGMSNEGDMKSNYVVLLAKFPLNTFNTTNKVVGYDNFEQVHNIAENGTFQYDYDNYDNYDDYDKHTDYAYDNYHKHINYFDLIGVAAPPVTILLILGISKSSKKSSNGYGYIGNKKIKKKNTPMFREIPCNKDIYYANTLIKLNNFNYNKTNILGAVILKWVRTNRINFKNEKKGIFNRNTSKIVFTINPKYAVLEAIFNNKFEQELYKILYDASKDGVLEAKELEKWCKNNYSLFLNLFDVAEESGISSLKHRQLIHKRKDKKECRMETVMADSLYEESQKLYGLKLYLEEFSRINTKEVMEVKLWDEYLMFAYLFGIADKVSKQLKNMYPEVVGQMSQINFNHDTIVYIDNVSSKSFNAAKKAKSAADHRVSSDSDRSFADSYSSGGGGYSSGGGGGGSFGGGGGGSR